MKQILKFLFAAMLILGVTSTWAQPVAPDMLVKKTANEVLEIIKKDKDIQAGDLRRIANLAEEKILPHFDFERMSLMVLGKHWSRASKEQQTRFVNEFRSLLIRTYSSALSKYRNQTIEYRPYRAQPGDTNVTVRTQIVQDGGPPLPIDYDLIKKGDSWKVYDIRIEGVSLVTTYRGQYSPVIRQQGMDGLIKTLVDFNNKGVAASAGSKQG